MDIKNKRIPDDEFARLRQEVLAQWPTGKDVDLQEAVDYHKAMKEDQIFSQKLLAAKHTALVVVCSNEAVDSFRLGCTVKCEHCYAVFVSVLDGRLNACCIVTCKSDCVASVSGKGLNLLGCDYRVKACIQYGELAVRKALCLTLCLNTLADKLVEGMLKGSNYKAKLQIC